MPNIIEGLTNIGTFVGKSEKFKGPETKTNKRFTITHEGKYYGTYEVDEIDLKEGVRCPDPRPSAGLQTDGKPHQRKKIIEHSHNAIHFLGGDMGVMYTYSAAVPELSAKDVVDTVVAFAKSDGRTITFHGDTREKTNEKKCGCGHVKNVIGKNELYGLPENKAFEIKEELARRIRENDVDANKAILEGSHDNVKAVLIVRKKINDNKAITKTVKPVDPNEQVFIYDETAGHDLLRRLVKFANEKWKEKGIEATEEEVIKNADTHAAVTFNLIAARLPVFETDPIDKVPKAISLGDVQSVFQAHKLHNQ